MLLGQLVVPLKTHVEWSALGIHLRFCGVSSVTGNSATAQVPSGSPAAFQSARLCTSWCTAAETGWRYGDEPTTNLKNDVLGGFRT